MFHVYGTAGESSTINFETIYLIILNFRLRKNIYKTLHGTKILIRYN